MRKEIKARIEMISRGEVPEGYKKTKVGIIPEDWEVKRLGEVSNGKGKYGANAPAVEYTSHLPKYLRITDIDDSGRIIKKTQMSVNIDNYDEFLLSKDDLVFARTGNTTGKTYLYNEEDGELVYAGFLIKFSINQKLASSKFIKLYTETKNYWDWVKVMSARSGQPGINSKEYEKLRVPQPALPEQQKIAQILSTWDQAIELKEKLIEEKKQQKKGLMQNLLTGEIRLPGFDGEWEEVRLGDISTMYSGGTPQTSNKEYYNGSIPWINSGDLNQKKIRFVEGKISRKGLENSSAKMVSEGDLLIALYGATAGIVGISCINAAINQAVLAIIPEKDDKMYLYYQLDFLKDSIINRYTQGGQPNLSGAIIKSLKINLPPLQEQKAIAKILSTADKEIDLLTQELEQLKLQKKGLMQLLLTGIVRVKS